jgi:HlyD family secretion protein
LIVARYKHVVLAVAIMLVIGLVLLRQWQGPLLQGYRIEPAPLVQTVVATGRVVTVSRAQVGSEITGVVLERRVREGDTVAAGTVLLVLRSDDLAAQVRQAEAALAQLASTTRPQAIVALERAESQLAQATRETERRRALANQRLLSAESLEQAVQSETLARSSAATARLTAASLAQGKSEETVLQERLQSLKAQLAKTVVRAEKAGTILTRNAEPGDLVQPGRVLFTMALAGDTEVLVPLDEKNLALLSLQQPALAVADAYPAQPFPAVISFIAPAIDPQRGTVDVRLKVDPVPAFLRQDMTVSVNIETGRRQQALVIPNDALTGVQGNVAQVMGVRAGKVQPQRVTLGLRGLAQSEILSGLQAGDVVIADAAIKIAAGSRVRIAEQPLPVAGSAGTSATRNELPVNPN